MPETPLPTWEEALNTLTGPGGAYEIGDAEIRGDNMRVFKSTPPSLRFLFGAARAHGDKPFLVYEDETWSFAETVDRADAIGAMLVERYGIKHGDRVGIAMRNYPEWIASFAAITSIGGIAVCLNAWWTTEEIDYALNDSGCALLIADRERLDRAAPVLERLDVPAVAVRCEGDLPNGVDHLNDVYVPGRPLPDVEIKQDDDAMILAAEIAGRSPEAVRGAKALFNRLANADAADQFAAEREVIGGLFGTPNQVEAIKAGMEGRDAVFRDA